MCWSLRIFVFKIVLNVIELSCKSEGNLGVWIVCVWFDWEKEFNLFNVDVFVFWF